MRIARGAVVAFAFGLSGSPGIAAPRPDATPTASATPTPTPAPADVPGSPSWAKDAPPQGVGFSSVAVTQSGVTYAPAEPLGTQSAADEARIADLPAWASAPIGEPSGRRDMFAALGLRRFGSLPEPATWALMIAGFALIGGALRGLIVANRRLTRLREEQETHEE